MIDRDVGIALLLRSLARLPGLLRILELLASRLELLLAAVGRLGGAPTIGLAMTELTASVTVALKLNRTLVAVEATTSASAVATSATEAASSAGVPISASSAVFDVASSASVSTTASAALWWK